jgi:dolichyl-phosphate beta-glucosyltransferase
MHNRHDTYDVSIVIPVFNGSSLLKKHLPPFLAWLNHQPYTTQIIIVDDGSHDRSLTAAYAGELGLLFLGLSVNKGKGAALRKGFQSAKGKIQLFTDADIPFNYRNIGEFVSTLQLCPCQLIIGDRTNPASEYFEKASFLRNFGSNLVSALVRFLFTRGVQDTQCGLKGMGQEVARRLFKDSFVNGFAIDIELIYLAHKHNVPLHKLPVQLRCNDKSSVRIVKDGTRLLIDIFRIRKTHGKKI